MWSKQWPTEPGYYWFFGWCWKSDAGNYKYHLVKVTKIINGICYVTDGHFLYKAEGAMGFWQKAIFPEAPDKNLQSELVLVTAQ